jgi:hypothetical protein
MNFRLRAFHVPDGALPFTVTGTVERSVNTFSICYVLRGALGGLIIPAMRNKRLRERELWNGTCCEFFLAIEGSPQYWEFNLSPSGSWNVYHFDNYRQGMKEERAFASIPFEVSPATDSLVLGLTFHLGTIMRVDRALELAVCAVMQQRDGMLTYWALVHPCPQPDFHRRESFAIRLQA